MTRRVAVRGIIIKDNKLLCVKLKAKGPDTYWCLPGGGVDEGESLLVAIEREMIEETAIKPLVGNLLFIQQFVEPEKNKEHLEFFFHVLNHDDYLNIDLSKTTHGEEEISEIDFIDPSTNYLLPEFLTTIDFSDIKNQHTRIFNEIKS